MAAETPSRTANGAPFQELANLKPGGERIVTDSDGSFYYSPDQLPDFHPVPKIPA